MNESSTRWIIGSTAAALWVTTALTAHVGFTMHWYLAIWLATALASCGVLICVADALARTRETRGAAGRAAAGSDVQLMCAAIEAHAARMETLFDHHAHRMESATDKLGERMRADVFDLKHWIANKYRGQRLADLDAAMEAERRAGSGTGPLPISSAGPR